ncbi:hypothetical protein HMPREF3159_03545 [Brachybacterium sp. HMSC06H03]|uniref:hypothetical protein n=1 Tax=Brachybacterium sp. HMSC06H03 TaxID=1581127 RepID=UPI0008A414F5|nr:hypothetical protein [Brachybacterium sp. HMSC06H03]OFT62599.1 hypothetical protein HMPREF3159_03545 [Brachybacterium sp. HMSC06H03]
MTTNDEQYTPSEKAVRRAYVYYYDPATIRRSDAEQEFDRFLARVRRDAARSAMEDLADDFDMWHQDMPTDEVASRIRHEMNLLYPEEAP